MNVKYLDFSNFQPVCHDAVSHNFHLDTALVKLLHGSCILVWIIVLKELSSVV